MLSSRNMLLMSGGLTPRLRLQGLFSGGRQGGLWLPDTLSGQFQDSAATTPVTADGDLLGYSKDFSGNARHLTQSTDASRPDWKDAGTVEYAHRVNGESLLVANSQALFKFGHDGSGMTVAAALRFASDSTTLIGTAASTAGSGFAIGRIVTTKRPRFHVGNGTSNVFSLTPVVTINDGEWHVYIGTYSTAAGAAFYLDGTSIGTAAESNAAGSSNSTSSFSWPLQGASDIDMAALLVIDRVISSAERTIVNSLFTAYTV